MSDRAPLVGDSRRDPPIFDQRGAPPLRWRVRVTPVSFRPARAERATNGSPEWQFEVMQEWFGYGLPSSGFTQPPGPPPPAENTDIYLTSDRELALAVAARACEHLRADANPREFGLIARQLTSP